MISYHAHFAIGLRNDIYYNFNKMYQKKGYQKLLWGVVILQQIQGLVMLQPSMAVRLALFLSKTGQERFHDEWDKIFKAADRIIVNTIDRVCVWG